MSYAVLAELPPVYGLFCALAGPLIYSLLGTSRHLSIGYVKIEEATEEGREGERGHKVPTTPASPSFLAPFLFARAAFFLSSIQHMHTQAGRPCLPLSTPRLLPPLPLPPLPP